MQITRGTVTVTGLSQTVTGDASALFKTGTPAVEVGDIFNAVDHPQYIVAAVDSDTQIKLDRGYTGSTLGGQAYTITKGFHRNLNMVRINKGDIELAELMHRNFLFMNNNFRHTADAPASATATGVKGTYAFDTAFLYVCVATNTWQRMSIATW
jgi:hypothetical protein